MKMNVSDKEIENTSNLGIEENNYNSDMPVEVCSGQSRASSNGSSILTSYNNLYSRELSESLIIQDPYSSKMLAMQKSFASQLIEMGLLIIDQESLQCPIEYNGNETLEVLVAKTLELFLHIITNMQKPQDCSHLEKSVYQQLFNAQKNIEDKELVQNTLLAFTTFQILLLGYALCGEPREAISKLKLDFNPKAPLIDGMDQAIDEAIIALRRLKEEKYFPVFRILIDCNRSLESKYQELQNYFGLKKLDDKKSFEHRFAFAYNNFSLCTKYIINFATYVAELQLLMVLFALIKKGQKTKENLDTLIVNVEIHLKHLGEQRKQYQKLKDCRIPHAIDYYEIKNCLYQLKCKLEKLKGKEVPVTVDDLKIYGEKEESTRITNEGFFLNELESKDDEILEDAESIEHETSVLFEAFRQLIESDRKTKLESKALKAIQKKQLNEEKDKSVIIEKKPEIIKLNTGNRNTLNELLQDTPPHLTITGTNVESLIEQLGGRTQQDGNGSIKIFWGTSNKQAGKYEVTHGGDRKGT
ncbi:MAG: hypothetical protein C5B43_01640, partial [Verrucomicrobia bacterium]